MLKLISAAPSPYARKVRIALAEKGIPFELLTEVPWDSTTSSPKHNPLEKLPVLLLEDGSSVYESSFILQYLELKYPQHPLLPPDVDGILAARKFEVLCDGLCDAMVLTFFERLRKDAASPEWVARQRRKIDGGLKEIARLAADHTWTVMTASASVRCLVPRLSATRSLDPRWQGCCKRSGKTRATRDVFRPLCLSCAG